jgi:RNA polymerase sigma-70 factor (ECF subfamily)
MESMDIFHHHNSADLSERIPKLQKGIALLKTEQRRCIELLYLQNKSYQEVAEITGYTLKNVKSYIQNGKRNLKNYLENG